MNFRNKNRKAIKAQLKANRKAMKAQLKALKCPTVTKTKNCPYGKSCDLNCENCPHNQLYPNQL